MQQSPAVVLNNICLQRHSQTIFQHFNATFTAGRWSCVLGASGVGKSSLLHLIAQLINAEAFSGTVSDEKEQAIDQQICYMAQTDLLLPWLTVLDNVLLGAKLRQQPAETDKAMALLKTVGLEKVIHSRPAKLSGGMRQRAALARTLMENKPIVLMDEPFASLDALTRQRMQDLAAKLLQHKTVIMVTHDPVEALRLAHDIYILQGSPATLTKPITPPSKPLRQSTDADVVALQKDLLAQLLAEEIF